jgi:thymidylate synthase (FAD)
MVVQAARVSTQGADSLGTGESAGLIEFLMRNRHGSPFESGYLRYLVQTPIFVAREFMRHRMASYSEVSGRYSRLVPRFYVPGPGRPLVQEGKAGEYRFEPGTETQQGITEGLLSVSAHKSAQMYDALLRQGIAKEVARMCLPVSTMTTFYVSMNPRGLMNFLSLRVKDKDAMFPSYPMVEIEEVARQMEELWTPLMPDTHRAFTTAGRVCP